MQIFLEIGAFLMEKQRIMTIFAHQDDETFSAGGTLAIYAKKGGAWAVSVTSDPNREEEFKSACKILGARPIVLKNRNVTPANNDEIIKQIISLIIEIKPEYIITHVPFDYHREHRRVHHIVLEAVEWASHTTADRDAHQVKGVFGAETTVLIPFPEILVDITDENDKRMKAIQCYESQLHKGGQGFYSQFHNHRTKLRGIQAGTDHAEAFVRFPQSYTGAFKPMKNAKELF